MSSSTAEPDVWHRSSQSKRSLSYKKSIDPTEDSAQRLSERRSRARLLHLATLANHVNSLVFVHGLNPFSNQNHAYDTWTHQNGRCWLYHFLPDDIPEARIWIFGYNSNVATDVSEARIKDHADVLLDRLQQKRKEGRVSIFLIKSGSLNFNESRLGL